jgi:hypothetical protein
MSGTTETVVSVDVLQTGLALMGYGAYLVVERLQRDYEVALAEFQSRAEQERQARIAARAAQQAVTAEAAALTAHTQLDAAVDASTAFLEQAVTEIAAAPVTVDDAALATRCAELLEAVRTDPDALAAHLGMYHQLQELRAGRPAEEREALHAQAALLRAEIDSPLLAEAAPGRRDALRSQLDALDALADGQPGVAAQGIGLFRARLYRELEELARRQQARAAQALELRALVGEASAKLAATCHCGLPEFEEQARALQARLAVLLAEAKELPPVQAVVDAAAALFDDARLALTRQATAEYVRGQVADVLLGLGYRVAEIPGEGASVASLGDGVGLEFHVDAQGRLGTAMVATEEGVSVEHAAQEKVCGLIDAVLAALREREVTVTEKFRRTLTAGQALPVVHVDTTAAPHLVATPDVRKVDTP